MAKSFRDFPAGVQTILLVVVAVVVVALPSYFYVYPLFAEKAQKETALNTLKKENESNRAFEQKLADYQAQIKALQQQLETLQSIVPSEPAMDQFMKMMFEDAGTSSIFIRTFVPQPVIAQKYYYEVPVRMRIDGTYWTLVNFFDRLSKEQRIVSVISLNLGPPSGGGMGAYKLSPGETVGANCEVVTYYNRAAAPAAPAKAAPKR
jgi:type IV pilus assembly protein PilO